jgi:quercetin dioxygenase-like cupin family protein
MISMKVNREKARGAALVLACIGVGFGMAVLHNKTQAQRAEQHGYTLNATEGEHLIRGGGDILIKVDPNRGSNSVALGTQRVPTGGRIPIHRHAEMDEAFYVVEGSGTFILNDTRIAVDKGRQGNAPALDSSAALPRRHVSRNR